MFLLLASARVARDEPHEWPVFMFGGGRQSLHLDQRHVPLHLARQRVEEGVERGR
jgi:hypothetical protein